MASPSEMSLMCRLCLLKDKMKVNIPIFEDRSDKLVVKIRALLPVKVSKEDQLPKKICDGCSDKLNLFYEFRNTSIESEQTLLSWLKDDNLTINAEQIAKPAETIVKEEVEVEEESPYLDLAQYSSIHEFQEAEEEEAEEPPAKRPRRFAAIKSQISIAAESDDDNDENELNTLDVEAIEYEFDKNDNDEDIAKSENESDIDLLPENSAYDQLGPSSLGKSEAGTPFMLKNKYLEEDIKNEIEVTNIELIGTKEIFIKEENNSSDANSSRQDVGMKFQCYTCKAKFQRKDILERHILLMHSDEKNFKCKICDAKFKTKQNLQEHLITHLDIYPFECETCKTKFKRKDNLRIHKLITHTEIYAFKCDICNAKFKQKCHLKRHKSKHSDEKSFQCNICDAKFKLVGDLRKHLIIHLDIYPFECDTCNAKFKRKGNLKGHILTHSAIYPFECDTCKAKFKRKYHLNRHILTHSDD